MAEVKKAVLGTFVGTLGNLSFTTWKGRNVVKMKGESKKEPTLPQLATREKFHRMQKINKAFASLIGDTFQNDDPGITAYNSFFKLNKNVIQISPTLDTNQSWTGYTLNADYSKLIVSSGNYFKPESPSVQLGTGANTTLEFEWKFGTESQGLSTDKVYSVVYSPEDQEILYQISNKDSQTISMEIPQRFQGKTCELYTLSSDFQKKIFSPSLHLGQLLIS